jgi:replicative DNA helicase Mcm
MKDEATRWTYDDGVEEADAIDPDLDPDLIRAWIAYARQYVHPRFENKEAKRELQEFYVGLREQSYDDEDAAIPVTARKLEACVRLAEASARIRLSESIEMEDIERTKLLIMSSLKDVGIDPETDEMDADVVETGNSKVQRERIKAVKNFISEVEEEHENGAPIDVLIERRDELDLSSSQIEHEIEKLRRQGDVYEPQTDHLRTI